MLLSRLYEISSPAQRMHYSVACRILKNRMYHVYVYIYSSDHLTLNQCPDQQPQPTAI